MGEYGEVGDNSEDIDLYIRCYKCGEILQGPLETAFGLCMKCQKGQNRIYVRENRCGRTKRRR